MTALFTLLYCGVAGVCGLVFGLLVVPFLEAERYEDPPRRVRPRRKD